MRIGTNLVATLILAGVLLAVPHTANAQGALERLGNLLNQLDPDTPPVQPAGPATADERPFLGAMLDELEENQGLVVTEVNPDGPADRAGLREGDVIRAVDDQNVTSLNQLGQWMEGKRPGDAMSIQAVRSAESISLNVRLGSMEQAAALPPPREPGPPVAGNQDPLGVEGAMPRPSASPENPRRLGVRVVPLTDDIRAQAGVSVRRGALVESVSAGGVADRAGIPAGAVIVSFDGRRVDEPVELIQLVQNSPLDRRIPVNYYLGNRMLSTEVYFGDPATAPPPAVGSQNDLPPAEMTDDRPALRLLQRAIGAVENGEAPPEMLVSPEEVAELRRRVRALEDEVQALQQEVRALRRGNGL